MCDVADSGGCGFDPGSVLPWRCTVAFGLGENGDQQMRTKRTWDRHAFCRVP